MQYYTCSYFSIVKILSFFLQKQEIEVYYELCFINKKNLGSQEKKVIV